jgi:hypothetical protein
MATGHQVSDFSDRAQTRPGLLTGGLLVRIQPDGESRWSRRRRALRLRAATGLLARLPAGDVTVGADKAYNQCPSSTSVGNLARPRT